MAARLKKKTMCKARTAPAYGRAVKKTTCKPRTASGYGRAVKKKQRVNLEPPRPMAARLKKKTECRTLTAPA